MEEALTSPPDPERLYTVETLAETLPEFPREAIESAIESLTAAGVLVAVPGPNGERLFRYAHPERYRMINTPVIKQPGPDFGKR